MGFQIFFLNLVQAPHQSAYTSTNVTLPDLMRLLNIGTFFSESTFNTFPFFAFFEIRRVVLGIYFRRRKMNLTTVIIIIIAIGIFLASLFSPKKGVTTTVLSIMVCMSIVAGLIFYPDPETLFFIVVIASFLIYGYGRFWRNEEGFQKKQLY
jgi:hypothetical protein